ncbi:MAG: hypothetical protein ABSF71_40990 [Terriglobia bacterium]|jgi:hypothetical protein
MTLTKRLSGEITDIRSIEFVCKSCGTSVSFNPAKWTAIVPSRCSNCPDAAKWTPTTDENIRQFAVLLTQLIKAEKDMPLEIRLDFELKEN